MEQYYEPKIETQIVNMAGERPQTTTRYGLGVIAVNDGSKKGAYGEAPPIAQEPFTWKKSADPELDRYRSYEFNWPGAIVLRQKWHMNTLRLLSDFPNIGAE